MKRASKDVSVAKMPNGIEEGKRKELFSQKLATLLLVQTGLLPPSVLGVKDLEDKV